MTVRIVTFVGGTTAYTKHRHLLQRGGENERRTGRLRYSARALWELMGSPEGSVIVILGTNEALDFHRPLFNAETTSNPFPVGSEPRVEWHFVDDAAQTVWPLYDQLVGHLRVDTRAAGDPTTEVVALDVTHGFRIQPMVALGAFTQVEAELSRQQSVGAQDSDARPVRLEAWYAREPTDQNQPVRFLELTDVLRAGRWTRAADAFRRYAQVDELVELVSSESELTDPVGLARKILELGAAFRTIRGSEVRDLAGEISAATIPGTAPHVVSDGLSAVQEAARVLRQTASSPVAEERLRQALEMATLLRERSQIAAATIVLGELITDAWISWFHRVEPTPDMEREDREQMRSWLNAYSRKTFVEEDAGGETSIELCKANLAVSSIRNDLAHAGRRNNPKNAEDIECELDQWLDRMKKLLDKMRDAPDAPGPYRTSREVLVGDAGDAGLPAGAETVPVNPRSTVKEVLRRVHCNTAAIIHLTGMPPQLRYAFVANALGLGFTVKEAWNGSWEQLKR